MTTKIKNRKQPIGQSWWWPLPFGQVYFVCTLRLFDAVENYPRFSYDYSTPMHDFDIDLVRVRVKEEHQFESSHYIQYVLTGKSVAIRRFLSHFGAQNESNYFRNV